MPRKHAIPRKSASSTNDAGDIILSYDGFQYAASLDFKLRFALLTPGVVFLSEAVLARFVEGGSSVHQKMIHDWDHLGVHVKLDGWKAAHK